MPSETTLSSLPNRPLTLIEGQALARSDAALTPVSVIADFPRAEDGGLDLEDVNRESPLIFALNYTHSDESSTTTVLIGYSGPANAWVEIRRWDGEVSHRDMDTVLEQWHAETYPDIGTDNVTPAPQPGFLNS